MMLRTKLLFILFALTLARSAIAECRDLEAMQVANDAAETLMAGEVFLQAKVLKKHLPSLAKEVATYIQVNELYYTVFYRIDKDCQPRFIKRTRGKR